MFLQTALATLVLVALTIYGANAETFTCPDLTSTRPSQPKNIIIDTDLLSFTDDVAAVAVANILQTKGFANVLGVVSDVTSQWSLPAIDAINTWYCHPNIPLARGSRTTTALFEPNIDHALSGPYITTLADNKTYPQDFGDPAKKTTDAVQFYIDTLKQVQTEKKKVTIIAIGFLTNLNNLYNQLEKDKNTDLIKDTVAELVVQGGSCNSSTQIHSAGYNLVNDISSAQVLTKWPSLVTYFPGFEASQASPSAQAAFSLPDGNPVKFVYNTITNDQKLGPHDILATYYAIFGLKALQKGEKDLFRYGNEGDAGALHLFVPDPSSALEDDISGTYWDTGAKPTAPQRYVVVDSTSVPAINNTVNNLLSCYGTQNATCKPSH